jgi:hypothetical protein
MGVIVLSLKMTSSMITLIKKDAYKREALVRSRRKNNVAKKVAYNVTMNAQYRGPRSMMDSSCSPQPGHLQASLSSSRCHLDDRTSSGFPQQGQLHGLESIPNAESWRKLKNVKAYGSVSRSSRLWVGEESQVIYKQSDEVA